MKAFNRAKRKLCRKIAKARVKLRRIKDTKRLLTNIRIREQLVRRAFELKDRESILDAIEALRLENRSLRAKAAQYRREAKQEEGKYLAMTESGIKGKQALIQENTQIIKELAEMLQQ